MYIFLDIVFNAYLSFATCLKQISSFVSSSQVLGERKVPPWTEIVLVPHTDKASLYPSLYLFTTSCRMVRPVRNLAYGKQELIGTFEQVRQLVVIYNIVLFILQII